MLRLSKSVKVFCRSNTFHYEDDPHYTLSSIFLVLFATFQLFYARVDFFDNTLEHDRIPCKREVFLIHHLEPKA